MSMKTKKEYKKIFVKQYGDYTCGLACLSMIIKYHGGSLKQEDLRNISGTTIQGTTLLGLYQAAKTVELDACGYIGDISSLKKIQYPSILHIVKEKNVQHYVVCFGFDSISNKFIIGDPSWGIIDINDRELEAMWNSKAFLTLEPTLKFKKEHFNQNKKKNWIKKIIKDDYPLISVSIILGVFISILNFSTAVFSQKLIDELLPSKDNERLIWGILLFLIILLFKTFLEYIRGIFISRQAKDFNNRMIDIFYSKILFLPKLFFDGVKTGEIISRSNDSKRIQETLSFIISNAFIDFLILIFSFFFLFIYSCEMASISLISIPAFFLLVKYFNKKINEKQQCVMVSSAITESLFIDTLKGIEEIKNANSQTFFKKNINAWFGLSQKYVYDLNILGTKYALYSQLISILIFVLLISFGVYFVFNEVILLGKLIASISISGMIISSTANLSVVNIRFQEADVSLGRFYEFVNLDTEFDDECEVKTNKTFLKNPHLKVKDLSFRYIGRKKILNDISIEAKVNEFVVLLGDVGSGKSTLIQLLQRYYTYESGNIYLNEIPISAYSIPKWREHIGVVNQHPKIFNGSVGENICLENFEEKRKEVLFFCEELGFNVFFDCFPQGLDTLVGEDGINLSGGQQQLVALARVLYQRPSLLLLDEPTSAMDYKTEMFVINMLLYKKREFAVIFVTHKRQLANYADKIYVLENNKITLSDKNIIIKTNSNITTI